MNNLGKRLQSSLSVVADLIFTGKGPEQMEQAGKKIIERNIQRYCGHDVVGFTAMDHLAGLVQYQSGHQHDKYCGDCQRQGRNAEDQGADTGQERGQYTYHQITPHETEVLAGCQGIGRKTQEDRTGATQGQHNQLSSIGIESEISVDHRSQCQTHKTGQGKDREQTPGTVSEI